MAKKEKAKREKGKLWREFKEFINKGNAFMLAVGVVLGSAFSAITNAFVSMLTSLCTWAVPGGIKGLVTVLPAVTDAQKGLEGIGQSFSKGDLDAMVRVYAASKGIELTADSSAADVLSCQNALLANYTLYGDNYCYNNCALINWGDLINAVISFIIVAVVLFIIVKLINNARARRERLEAEALERYYEAHPEERPVPPEPGKPVPTESEILTQILAELKKQNAAKAAHEGEK